eukprot:7819379-Ditylum_brightwellii.AAC.1
MSDDEGDNSLDEFESMNEELSVESAIVDVSDASLSSESSSPSEIDEESTIGGDFAKDHKIKRQSGSYINSYVLINSGGM